MGLQLNLFGPPSGQIDSKLLAIHKFRKPFALLCYVTLKRSPVPRLFLATFFWPNQSEKNALMNLRKTLTVLRKQVGDHIQSNFHEVWLNQNLSIDLDLAPIMYPSDKDDLTSQTLIALHRGEFFEGFYLRNAISFENWVQQERTAIEHSYLSILNNLALEKAKKGLFDEAIACGKKQLDIDPLQEHVHQNLILWYGQANNRVKALEQYDQYSQVLKEELGLEPSVEIKRLKTQITDNKLEKNSSANYLPHKPVISEQANPQLFFGRTHELAQLENVLKKGLQKPGQIYFIEGEAGQGKTRLLVEFAYQALARHHNLMVLYGQNDTFSVAGGSLLIFREILHQLIGSTSHKHWPAELQIAPFAKRIAPHTTRHLRTMMEHSQLLFHTLLDDSALLNQASKSKPHLGKKDIATLQDLISRPLASPIQAEQLLIQLFDMLQTIAENRPLLLILDNLQWADAASIQFLVYITRRLNRANLTVFGAFRTEEIVAEADARPHPLRTALLEIKSLLGNTIINLDHAVPEEFVHDFVDSRPNQLDGEFRKSLIDKTNGHPLFTIELYSSLLQHGDIFENLTGTLEQSNILQWNHMPAKVEGVIAQKFLRIPAATREILQVASVVGKEFSAEVLAQAMGLAPALIVKQLGKLHLKSQRIIEFIGSTHYLSVYQSRYQFHHDLIQQYLYGTLDQAQRFYIHQQVGQAFETLYTANLEPVANQLAYHFEQCQDWSKTIDYLTLNGRRELKRFSYAEVKRITDKAIEILNVLDNDDLKARSLPVYHLRGVVCMMTDGYSSTEAHQAHESLFELSQKFKREAYHYPSLFGLWSYYISIANGKRTFQTANQLAELAQDQAHPDMLMGAYFTLGLSHFFAGDFKESQKFYRKAESHFVRQSSNSIAFQEHNLSLAIRFYRALAEAFLGNFERAKTFNQTGHLNDARSDNLFIKSFCKVLTCLLFFALDKPEKILATVEREIEICEEHQLFQPLSHHYMIFGWALGKLGRTEKGIEYFIRGFELQKNLGLKLAHSSFLAFLAEIYLEAKQPKKALSVLNQAEEGLYLNGTFWVAEIYRLRGRTFELLKKPSRKIIENFEKAISTANEQNSKTFLLKATRDLAHHMAQNGNTKQAYTRLLNIYNSFTEGYEEIPLLKAKLLLDELENQLGFIPPNPDNYLRPPN